MNNVYVGMIVRKKKDGTAYVVDEIDNEYVFFHELNNKFGYQQKLGLRIFLEDYGL